MKNIEDLYELAPTQQGMLFRTLSGNEPGIYFEQFLCTLTGRLNISAFEQAWQHVVDRNAILRTSFHWEKLQKPLQAVHRHVDVPLTYYNWRDVPEVKQQERLSEFLKKDRNRGFKLTKAPLIRLFLIQISTDRYEFVWSRHHLLLDRWSRALVFKEVFACYEACCKARIPDLVSRRPYADYIGWLQQQEEVEGETYWRRALKGFTAPTQLGIEFTSAKSREPSHGTEEQTTKLSVETTAALSAWIRHQGLTLNTVIHGIWALLLSRYSGKDDVLFGATVSGRPASLAGADAMVGLFINSVPVRVKVPTNTAAVPWLKDLQKQLVGLREYEHIPLADIHRWSEVPGNSPLFDSLLVFENIPTDNTAPNNMELEIGNYRGVGSGTGAPLTLIIEPASQLTLYLFHDSKRFSTDTVSRLLRHFQFLLDGVIANSTQCLADLYMLSVAERRQLLQDWNATQADYPRDQCIHELFEAQVEKTTGAVAVEYKVGSVSYGELNKRANKVAHYLQGLGVGPTALVGISVEHSLEMIVGLLGILKAGAAYIAFDPTAKRGLRYEIFDDRKIQILITQHHLLDRAQKQPAQVICLDSDWDKLSKQSGDNPKTSATSGNLVYVMYTSEASAEPLETELSHRSLCNVVWWQRRQFADSGPIRTLQLAAMGSDASLLEIFSTLLTGGALVIAQEELQKDPTALSKFLAQKKIERVFVSNPLLQSLATANTTGSSTPKLRDIVIVGGRLSVAMKLVDWCNNMPGVRIHNQYGASGFPVVTNHTLNGSPKKWPANPPIGRPISNTQIYLVDNNLQPVPTGVPGNIYISANGLTPGSHNRQEPATQRFIANPFGEGGSVLFKTGDLGRYRHDGEIEFAGHLEKGNGNWGSSLITEDLERVLCQHPAVQNAVIAASQSAPGDRSDSTTTGNNSVAYVVCDQTAVPTPSELRDFLRERVAEQPIPLAYVTLEALPLKPDDTVDKAALPMPGEEHTVPERHYVAPRDNVELQLVEVWEKVLGVRPIGVRDNFFDIGGYSLTGVALLARITETFGKQITLTTFVKEPTIEQLAIELRLKKSEEVWSPLVPLQSGGAKLPLFFVPGGGCGELELVRIYSELARQLGPEQPFYGLKVRGSDGHESHHPPVSEIAAEFIEAIRSVQSEGPYLLAGDCTGGLIAFEMAQQMKNQGHEVGLLAVLDTVRPQGAAVQHFQARRVKGFWTRERRNFQLLWQRFQHHVNRLRRLTARDWLAYIFQKLGKARDLRKQHGNIRKLKRIRANHIQTLYRYRPQRYAGRITLLLPEESALASTTHVWEELAGGGIEIYRVPGNHKTYIREYVNVTAAQLGACIQAAQSGMHPTSKIKIGKPLKLTSDLSPRMRG